MLTKSLIWIQNATARTSISNSISKKQIYRKRKKIILFSTTLITFSGFCVQKMSVWRWQTIFEIIGYLQYTRHFRQFNTIFFSFTKFKSNICSYCFFLFIRATRIFLSALKWNCFPLKGEYLFFKEGDYWLWQCFKHFTFREIGQEGH